MAKTRLSEKQKAIRRGGADSNRKVLYPIHDGPQELLMTSDAEEILYGGSLGGGKDLSVGTKIPTPMGWKLNGDLVAGDYVLDEQGRPNKVLVAYPSHMPERAYRLVFDDGSTIEASNTHLWLTYSAAELAALTRRDPAWRARRRAKRPSRARGNKSAIFTAAIAERNRRHAALQTLEAPTGSVRTTDEVVRTLRLPSGQTNHAIPVAKALELPEKDFLLDPYLLGVWLGDGTAVNGQICTMDVEIDAAFIAAGFSFGKASSQGKAWAHKVLGLQPLLQQLDVLGNKHIPPQYLRASKAQRLALLQGLMDTDGTVCSAGLSRENRSNGVEFTNTNKNLIDGVYELIVSLGWKARIIEGRARLNGKDCGPKWDIKWTPDEYVFRLTRKRKKQRLATRRVTKFRYIVDAIPIEPIPMRCISVESPSSLYLAGDSMIPTHNSYGLRAWGVSYCLVYPGAKVALFRQTFPQLEQSHLIAIQQEVPESVAHYSPKDHTLIFPNGSILFFCVCEKDEDARKFDTTEFDALLFDELTHFTKFQYEYLISRMRSTKDWWPGPRIRAAATPLGRGHDWVKERWVSVPTEDGGPILPFKVWTAPRNQGGMKRLFIPARVTDNPALMNSDPDYIRRLETLPYEERIAKIEGNWDTFTGQFFQRWRPSVHIIAQMDIPPDWDRFMCVDYGFFKPYAVLWFARPPGSDTAIFYREQYGTGVKLDEQVRLAREAVKATEEKIKAVVLDPAMFGKVNHKGEQFEPMASDWKAVFNNVVPGNNERIVGWRLMREMLDWQERPDGGVLVPPRLFFIQGTCPNAIRTLPNLICNEHNLEDVDTDKEDHAADAIRYGLRHAFEGRGRTGRGKRYYLTSDGIRTSPVARPARALDPDMRLREMGVLDW